MTALQYFSPTSAHYFVGDNFIASSARRPFVSVSFEEEPAAESLSPAVVSIRSRKERMKARFRLLRRLPENYDNEGASRPIAKTVDAAIAFIDRMRSHPDFFVTLDDDGSAVIEFKSVDSYGDITFFENGQVECYARPAQGASSLVEGDISSVETRTFLESRFGVVLV